MFKVFISALDNRTECNLDHKKSRRMADRLEVTATVQRHLNGLKKWAFKNPPKFNKCKQRQYRLWNDWTGSSFAIKI